jgi:hypothetical protein
MAGQLPKRRTASGTMSRHRLRDFEVAVMGEAATSRQICLQLVAFGVTRLRLFAGGRVRASEFSLGGYRADDIGRLKADAVGDACHQANPQLDFLGISGSDAVRHTASEIVFCCAVSAIERCRLWNQVKSSCQLWLDVQSSDNTPRIVAAYNDATQHGYHDLLAASSGKKRSSVRTAPFCISAMAASLAVYQFTQWLKGLPVPFQLSLDLNSELLRVGRE